MAIRSDAHDGIPLGPWSPASACCVFGTLQGIVVAIILSLIGLTSQIARTARVTVIGRKRGGRRAATAVARASATDETFEGLLILRPEGRLFFANAQNVAQQIVGADREAPAACGRARSEPRV